MDCTDTELQLIVKSLAHERWGREHRDADAAAGACLDEARAEGMLS